MAKKKLVADPFFPDSQLDIADFDFDIPEPKDDRSPVTKVVTATAEGAVSSFKDSSFINRLLRQALPPVYGEIDDLRSEAFSGVKKLYNSAAKEIKPSIAEMSRSVGRLIPAEKSRLKKSVEKINKWATGDKSGVMSFDDVRQREQNIALEIGQVFSEISKKEQAQDIERLSEDRAEKRVKEAIENNRYKDNQSALNAISFSVQSLATYNDKVTAAFQRKSLELQMRSYFQSSDAYRQSKIDAEKMLAELKVITKNTALPEFVKIRKTEAFKEHLRNRFISEMNTGLLGKRAGLVRNFFDRVGRGVQDKAIEAAGLFSQGAGMADAAESSASMKDMGGPGNAEMVGNIAGGLGAQSLALRAGKAVRRGIDANPKASKIASNLEYNVRNIPQALSKYAKDQKYDDNFAIRSIKSILGMGIGSLAPDARLQTDSLLNTDPNGNTGLRSMTQFTNQNSKSINEIIPGFLSRIFRELQVIRTGNNDIGLTSYDYTKNRFLDSGKVSRNILKTLAGDVSRQAHSERVSSIMSSIGADKELDKDTQDSLAEVLTSANLKGVELSPEYLSNPKSYAKGKHTNKHSKKIAELFKTYFNQGVNENFNPKTVFGKRRKEQSLAEAAERKNQLNNNMTKLGGDFNDGRAIIQELVNLGQYEELRALGLINEDKKSINMDRLIELYNSDKKFKATSYGVGGRNTLGNISKNSNEIPKGNEAIVGELKGVGSKDNQIFTSMDSHLSRLTSSFNEFSENYSSTEDPNYVTEGFDPILEQSKRTNELLDSIRLLVEDRLKIVINKMPSTGVDGGGVRGMAEKFGDFKTSASDRFDTIGGSLKNAYNQTIGKGVKALKPLGRGITSINKFWWNKTAKPLMSATAATASAAGRVTRDQIFRIRDIYVGDETEPRLLAAKLKAGKYFNAVTGDVVKKLHQISDGVKDENGDIVLQAKEVELAYTRNAKGGIINVAKEFLGNTVRNVGNFNTFMNKTITIPALKAVASITKGMFGFGRKLFDQPTDIYVKGDEEPRLLALIMRKGGYFSKDTQKPVTRPSEIDGVVLDAQGNIVLSLEDLKKGITDKHGNSVGSPLMNALRFVGAGIKATANIAKSAIGVLHKGMGAVLGGGAELLGNFFGQFATFLGGGKSYDVLVQIKQLLDKRLPENKKKRKFKDSDGDGIRDGSTEDILKKGLGKRGTGTSEHAATVRTGRENTLDKIARLTGEAKDGITDFFSDGPDVDIDIDGKDKGKGRGRSHGRKRSKFQKLKDYFKRNKGVAAKGAGSAATAASAAKAAGLGAGAAGASSAATAAGAAGAAGAGAAGTAAGAAGLGTAAKFGLGTGLKVLGGVGTAYGIYSGVNNLMDGNYGSAAVDLGLAGVSGAATLGGAAGVGSLLGGTASTLGAIGGAALTGAGAILTSPVLLGALAVGAVGYGAYKLYKHFNKIKPLERMRLAQYGFGSDDEDYLGKVSSFEKAMLGHVKYDDGGKARLDIDDKSANKLITYFDFEAKDKTALNNWIEWVQGRFKPVFLTHMTALKNMGLEGKLLSIDSEEADVKLKYFNNTKFDEGPYSIIVSPFPTLKNLGMGFKAVDYVTKEVQKAIDKEVEESQTKKTGSIDGGAAGALTSESARAKMGLVKGETDNINAAAIDNANQSVFSNLMKNYVNKALMLTPVGAAVASFKFAANKIGKWLGFSVEADEAVRFKTYGLIEMDRLKVIALRGLEQYMAKQVKFGSDGKAVWEGKIDDILLEVKADFEITSRKDEQAKFWIKWFVERFTPTYLNYRSWLKQATGKDEQEAAEKSLKAEDRADVAVKVAACDVWSKTISPWKDYTLSTDASSCRPNLELLDSIAKDSKLRESKAPVKPTTSGLGNALNKNKDDPQDKVSKAVKTNNESSAAKDAISQGDTKDTAPPDAEAPPPSSGGVSAPNADSKAAVTGVLKKATGDLRDGTGADKHITYHKNSRLDGANPEMVKLFRGMAQEYGEMTGKVIQVNSGKRTTEEQAAEHKANPSKAAPPGGSLHEFGLAIDINSATADELDKLGLMRKYGFTRPIGGEKWHIEPAGIQGSIHKVKKNGDLATDLVKASVGKGGGGWGTKSDAGKYTRNSGYAQNLFNTGDSATNLAESEAAGTPSGTINGDRAGEIDKQLKAMNAGKLPVSGVGASSGDMVGKNKDAAPGQAQGFENTPAPKGNKGYAAVKDTIAEASRLVGVDEKTMVTKAALESSFNPSAGATTSNAKGLYQFVPETWNEMMAKYGKKYGIPAGTSPNDARANSLLAAQYMKDNEKTLKKAKGDGSVTMTDQYMAHFFGPTGATKMIGASPDAIGAEILPKGAADNKETFYDKNGRPRTVGEIRKFLDDKIAGTLKSHGIDESQFKTQVAKTEEGNGNSNIVKASFNSASEPAVQQPKVSPQSLPKTPTPEGLAAKEREKQRMSFNDALMPKFPRNNAVATQQPLPIQAQNRQEVQSFNTKTDEILQKQVGLQEKMVEVLGNILAKIDLSDLKDMVGKMAESKSSGVQDPIVTNKGLVDRSQPPIAMKRMT